MKPRPPQPEKEFGKDMKAFEQLPAKTKELIILQSALGIDVPPAKVPADRNGRHPVKDRHASRR